MLDPAASEKMIELYSNKHEHHQVLLSILIVASICLFSHWPVLTFVKANALIGQQIQTNCQITKINQVDHPEGSIYY